MHQRQLVAQPQGQSTFAPFIAQESLCTAYCSACQFPLSPADPTYRNCGAPQTAEAIAAPRRPQSLLTWTLAFTLPALLFLSALSHMECQVHAATTTMVAEGGRQCAIQRSPSSP